MRRWRTYRVQSAAAAAIAGLFGLATTHAQDEVSFRGKTVRMIVGSTPGGVTDVGARAVARFLGKYLPQSPTVIVQNMPAANGIAAANYFYRQAPPDGLTFLAGSSSQVTPDVIRTNPAVRYDPARFAFIGGVQNAGTLLIVAKSAQDRLLNRSGEPVVMAQVGGARTAALIAVLGAEYLGWNLRWVTGYQGTPQVVFALMKGEADMLDTAGIGAIEPLLKSGHFVPRGPRRQAYRGCGPRGRELAQDRADRQVLRPPAEHAGSLSRRLSRRIQPDAGRSGMAAAGQGSA